MDNCKVLRLNARTGQHNALTTYAGINLPLVQCTDLTGGELEPITDYRDSVERVNTGFPRLLRNETTWEIITNELVQLDSRY